MTLTYYGKLCTEAYNLTKPIGRDYPDIPYFIRYLSPRGGRILEGMVGTSRLLIPLLETGLQVEGIDSSPDMLAACRRNCVARGLAPILHQGSIGREEFMMCLRENGYTDIQLCANYVDDLKPISYQDQLCFSATLA